MIAPVSIRQVRTPSVDTHIPQVLIGYPRHAVSLDGAYPIDAGDVIGAIPSEYLHEQLLHTNAGVDEQLLVVHPVVVEARNLQHVLIE